MCIVSKELLRILSKAFWALAVVGILLASGLSNAQEAVVLDLDNVEHRKSVNDFVSLFEDREDEMTFSEVRDSPLFASNKGHPTGLGFDRGGIWMKLSVRVSTDTGQTILMHRFVHTDRLSYYLTRDNELIEELVSGDTMPFSDRAHYTTFPSFYLPTAPGEHTIYLHHQTDGSAMIGMDIVEPEGLFKSQSIDLSTAI